MSVYDIAKDLLIGNRTVTVVVPTVENNNNSDNFEPDDIYPYLFQNSTRSKK